jgi:HEAT repeat protein
MKFWVLAPVALLSACFGVDMKPETPNEPPATQHSTQADQFMAAVEKLKMLDIAMMDRIQNLEKNSKERSALVEERLKTLEDAVSRLISNLNTIQKGVAQPHPNGDDPKPVAKPVEPGRPKVDALTLLSETNEKMKGGPMAREDLARRAADMQEVANQAVTKFIEELRQNMDNHHFVNNFMALMAAFPAANTSKAFADALKEIRLRGVICETIEKSGQLDLSRILEDFSNTADDNFRAQIGRAMTSCKNPAGVPLLLIVLRSQDENLRTIAILTLKTLAGGKTFGYDFFLSPESESNRTAIAKWDAWYEQNKANLFK